MLVKKEFCLEIKAIAIKYGEPDRLAKLRKEVIRAVAVHFILEIYYINTLKFIRIETG